MDPPNVDVDVQVLVLFLGVEHTVVSYYVTESETWGELEDGCYAFRDRLERLRNLSQYQSDEYKLEFWVDDKCCEGRDVLDHPVVRIFGLPRAPYKDLWHAINNVTKTCHVGFILDQQRLAVGLSKSLRELLGPDVEKVVEYLMAQRGLSKQAAEVVARKTFRTYGTIRSRAQHVQAQLEHFDTTYARWELERNQATHDDKPCCIRKPSKFTIGTLKTMKNLRAHIEKGCLNQPLPCKDMYLELPVRQ